jgi:hypothetical protein
LLDNAQFWGICNIVKDNIVSNVKTLQLSDFHHMDRDFNSTKFSCSHEKKKMTSHKNYSGDALILELLLGLVAWKIYS